MRLLAREPDPVAFASYGALIEGPSLHGDRRLYSDWLAPVPGLRLQFHINSVAKSDLPVTLDRIERHPNAAQVFIPLNVGRYLVTVMPCKESGRPDPAGALSMVLPGTVGVVYRSGCWHAGVTVIDRDAQFAVLMWRGAEDDDVFEEVPPFTIHASAAIQTGTYR